MADERDSAPEQTAPAEQSEETAPEVAAEAGFPGAARAVGTLLRRFEDLPWWRIVNASGRLVPGHAETQADLLAGEGVQTKNGRVPAS